MKKILLILVALSLQACTAEKAPVIVFLGSYFPVWIFYFIASIILVLIVRVLLIRAKVDQLIEYKLVFYFSLIVIFAFLFSRLIF